MVKHAPPELRREQILLAAMTVCGERGYHATRIDDIADRAGLSKGAIYHHFASKQDIFVSLLERMLDESTDQIAELDAGGVSLREAIHSVFAKQLDMVADNPQLIRGLFEFYLLSFRDPTFRERFDHRYQAMIDRTSAALRHAAERGELRSDVDPERTARVLIIGGDGLMLMHVMLDQEAAGVDAAYYFTDLLMNAITKERDS